MTLDPLLIEVLACPEDKGPLLYFEDENRLYNPRLHRSYEIRDDIPVMLIDEASTLDETEHRRLMEKADAGGARRTGETSGSGGTAGGAAGGGPGGAPKGASGS